MVNIRDQCSWVHMQEKEAGTEKAKDLVRMGVAKARFLEPQEDIESSLVRRVLVIGGGVAGLSAVEALADMGMEVFLVEKAHELGGLLKRVNRLAPSRELASDFVRGLIDKVTAKPNVKTSLKSEVTCVGGVVGNYEVTIRNGDGAEDRQTVGCIVLATGAVPFKPEGMHGYSGKDVFTQIELEEQLAQGAIDAKNVVMIQCVGARCEEREYCSRICCFTAVKNAVFIKEQNPEAHVTILYRDIQMYGSENEKLLWDSRGVGVRYDVYNQERPPVVKENLVEFYEPLIGETTILPYDLVVLSTPLVAPADAQSLSQLMRIPIDRNNFFLEAHAKLRPLDFASDGVYLCGTARYPATVGEARAQGLGAASRAGTVLLKDKLVASPLVAAIHPEACCGCQGCLEVCPYGAIRFVNEKGVCEVNTILCKGCGNCASTCPSSSVQLKGFTPRQLLSQIREIVC
jgi:heterodisulfide reductase subunit A2